MVTNDQCIRMSKLRKEVFSCNYVLPSKFSITSTLFKARFKYSSFFRRLTFSETNKRNTNHPNKQYNYDLNVSGDTGSVQCNYEGDTVSMLR